MTDEPWTEFQSKQSGSGEGPWADFTPPAKSPQKDIAAPPEGMLSKAANWLSNAPDTNAPEKRTLGTSEALGRAALSRTTALGQTISDLTPVGQISGLASKLMGAPDVTQSLGNYAKTQELNPNTEQYASNAQRTAAGIAGVLPDLAAAAGTGGAAELPLLTRAVPAIADAAPWLQRGIHGIASMALPAITSGREAYDQAQAAGLGTPESIKRALMAGGETALGGAGPAGVTGNLATRVASGAATNAGIAELMRRGHNLISPEDQQEAYDPAQSIIAGVLGGGLHGAFGAKPAARPPAEVAPSIATPPLGLTHEPDFIVDAQGRTIANKGDRTLGQPVPTGGPGMDQPATPRDAVIMAQREAPSGPIGEALAQAPTTAELVPRGTTPPAEPATGQAASAASESAIPAASIPGKSAPLPTTEPAGERAPPGQPVEPAQAGKAAVAASDSQQHDFTTQNTQNVNKPVATLPQEPAAAALASDHAPVRTATESDATGQTSPSAALAKPSLQENYAARQGQIDALNDKRKAGGLSDQENSQLHDLRDEHELYDPLTGLLNNKGFDNALASGGYSHTAALDLDQFKPLNDTFGHQAGDLVLQHVAQVLHDSSGGDVTVARLHGDEYAGLAKGDPTEVMRKAQEALRSTPFEVTSVNKDGSTTQHIVPGIGITFGVGHDYATADAAAIASKPTGGRRNTDIRSQAARPEDVQAPAGGAAEKPAVPAGSGIAERPNDVIPSTERVRSAEVVNDHARTQANQNSGQPIRAAADLPAAGVQRQVGVRRTGSTADLGPRAINPGASRSEVGTGQPTKSDEPVAATNGKDEAVAKRIAELEKKSRKSFNDFEELRRLKNGEPLKSTQTATAFRHGEAVEPTRADAAHFDRVSKVVSDAKRAFGDNGPDVHVLRSAEELPESAKQQEPERYKTAKGFIDKDGSVYIVAKNLRDPHEARTTLMHEAVGHYGVDHIIGDHVKGGWDKLTSDIERLRNDSSLGSKGMRDAIVSVERRYPNADRDTFAKELVAVMAERGIRNGILDRVVAAVRAFVRKFNPDMKLGEQDIHRLLRKSEAFVRSDISEAPQQRAPSFDRADPTDSAAFKSYFGDSKVVNEDGTPRIVHHGTADEFNEFKDQRAGDNTGHMTAPLGHFFDEQRGKAKRYAEKASQGVPVDERVIDAYLHIANPKEMTLKEFMTIDSQDEARTLKAQLQKEGYDGIKLGVGGRNQWIAFDSRQVKSVDNKGTFDRGNPDIRFSLPDREEREPLNPREARTAAVDIAQVAKDNRENARNEFRSSFATAERNTGKADAAMDALRKTYDKLIATYQGDNKKLYASISALERGEKVDDHVANALWTGTSALLREQLDRLNGLGADVAERANYFAHIWKDQGRAATEDLAKAKKDEALPIGGRRPLSGNKQFTKERVFNTIEDGLNAGREPVSKNPVDMFMARYAQGEKLGAALTIKKSLGDRGFLKELEDDRVPPGYQRVNDGVFAGKVLPELIARDLNNHLDPGLSRFVGWRSFRYVQNLMLSARLGLSAFHAGMTTLDSMATHIDIGVRRAASGDLTGSLHELFKASLAPLTAMQELAGKGAGSKLMRQFYGKEATDPHTAALLNFLTEGGARGRMSATDYNNSLTSFRRAMAQGNIRTATTHAIPAAIEGTTHLIAHNLVPAQKMTARVLLAKFELDRVADKLGKQKGDYAGIVDELGTDALRQMSRKINADVDDRLGQFAYDNEFWNKTVKDALHASIQSVGWNFGSLRLLGGGAGDVRKLASPESVRGPLDKAGNITDAKLSRLTGRLSYLITLNAVVATMGAMTQYALTGQGPQEAKDFFFPKTGRKNNDDSDERLAFPSYVKDEYSFTHSPLQTVLHKLHPTLSMLAEIAKNKDFYGTQVYDPDASLPQEAKQFMTYLGKSFLPYSLSGAAKNAKTGSSLAMSALPFIGVTPASGEVSKSPFQSYVSEKYFETLPQGARTQAKAEQSAHYRDAINAIRHGEKPDTSGMTTNQIRSLNSHAKTPLPESSFQRLDLLSQLHAWNKASPQERQNYKLRQIIMRSAASKITRLPPEQRQEVQKQVNAIATER